MSLVVAISAAAQPPELAIVGGAGSPGATVEVAIRLSGDTAATGVSADVDLRFPVDQVEFDPPVTARCRVASRLADTHQVGGRLLEPGLLSLALFAKNLEIHPLADGELVACDFRILASAAPGQAPLGIEFVGLGDAVGMELAVRGRAGAIRIGAPLACSGDCDANATVTIDELIRGVRIALGDFAASACEGLDTSGDGEVTIPELITAVRHTLDGCP